jgi:integrase/recombinase XerD
MMPALLPFSMIKPEAWPIPFQLFLDARVQPDDPLRFSRAIRWRPATFRQYTIGLGYFLGWLHWSERYQENQGLRAYVTRDIAKAYLADMEKFGLAPPTMASRLDALHAALAVVAPDVDRSWLMAGINRLRSLPSDRRRTRERVQHTADVVEVGMRLMREADRMDERHALWSAIQFRDGLLLVFAALVVPRIGTVPKMLLGKHVIQIGAACKISWSAEEMKGGQPYEARLGPELSALLARYIAKYRPVLLARRKEVPKDEPAFWLSRDGTPLSQRQLAMRITNRTKTLLGVSVFPHALRHGAATTLAIERPELIDIVTPLLQHRHTRSRQHYNVADGVAAGRDFGKTLEARRASNRDGRRLMRRLNRATRHSGPRPNVDAEEKAP